VPDAAMARAGNAKDFYEFLEEFHPGTQDRLRQRLPGSVLERIHDATRIDWNDVEATDGPYVTAIVDCLGAERARQAWRVYTSARFIKTPAIRALAEGAARLFGISVASYVRMIPFAFHQGFRNCGDVVAQLSEREAPVEVKLTRSFASFDAYAVLLHGLFLGIFDIAHAEPQLEYRPDLGARRVSARFRW